MLGRIQSHLELSAIEPPTIEGQPLIIWFSVPGRSTPAVGYVADHVVELHYLLVDRSQLDADGAAVIDQLDLVTEDQLLARSLDDPWDAADVAIMLGVVAAVPWSPAVEDRIASLERHEEIGVEASARLARQYRDAIERASPPEPDPSSN